MLGVLTAAVLAAIALLGSESQASHTTLHVDPSYHVDIGTIPNDTSPASTGNSYDEDPDGNFDPEDQLMSVSTPLNSCQSVTVSDFSDLGQSRIVTDIIIKNAQELFGADIRINYDPSLIQVFFATITPYTGGFISGFQAVGLANLPFPSGALAHRAETPGSLVDNTNGAGFFAGTYEGERLFEVSSESGPDVDGGSNSLPDRNVEHAPDGGVFVQIKWDLLSKSNGRDIRIDLTTAGPSFKGGGEINVGSQFVTLTGESPETIDIITLGNHSLFDGIISVNKASPDPCPPPDHDVEAKHIAGTKGSSTLKLFQSCNSDPCTTTQNHSLNVRNNGNHTEDIRVLYQLLGWPKEPTGCTVTTPDFGTQVATDIEPTLTLSDTVELAVPDNASRNVKVLVTFSCPSGAAEDVVGVNIALRLTAVLQTGGVDDVPDDDPANDAEEDGKKIR